MLFILGVLLLPGAAQAQDAISGTGSPGSPPTLEPRPCRNIDGEGPEMVIVDSGLFNMGATAAENGSAADERPRHPVTIVQPFALSRCETSVGQFRRFVDETGYATDAERGEGCYALNEAGNGFDLLRDRDWRSPGFSQDEDHPVVCVSWNDANAYAEWLSARTGRAYRLPSEAEWEYAARGGSETSRFWGEDPDRACDFANGADLSAQERFKDSIVAQCRGDAVFTSPGGHYRRNAFGLSDVLGNAWEWVRDCWHGDYNGAPGDGSAWEGEGCSVRVLRGGGWYFYPENLRSATRIRGPSDVAGNFTGFRLARTL